ncbi:HAD family phosphatase [bacterium]|nr:HAD family phosphatase [bacterium]
MFEAILFDMDGVIADSEPLHIKAERAILAPFNLDIPDEAFHVYMGRTPRLLLEGFIADYNLPVSIDDLYPVHASNLLALYRNEVTAIPGALDCIAACKRAGFMLGLASSSDRSLIDTVIRKFELDSLFTAVTSGEEVAVPKPAPDIFLLEARKLGVDPAYCLVIEDSTNGIRAARAAGMSCIGFESPNSHNQDYSEADLVIDALSRLDMDTISALWQARSFTAR